VNSEIKGALAEGGCMFESMSLMDVMKLFLPLILVQVGLMVFCLVLIWRKGVRNLSPLLWSGIVVLLNLVGPLAFLLVGRKLYSDDRD